MRLALSGHVGIARENEPDFLTEADAAFTPPQRKAKVSKSGKVPVALSKPKTQVKKQKTAKKQIAAFTRIGSQPVGSRTLFEKEDDDVPVQLQTQDRQAGRGEVRAASPLQPRA